MKQKLAKYLIYLLVEDEIDLQYENYKILKFQTHIFWWQKGYTK